MIIDALFVIGTVGFLLSDIKQFYKLHKHTITTNAISRTHLKMKFVSLICVSTGYFLTGLYASTIVSMSQLVLNIGVFYYTVKYYDHSEG